MYMVRLTKKVEFSLKNAQKLEFSGNPDEVGNPEKKFLLGDGPPHRVDHFELSYASLPQKLWPCSPNEQIRPPSGCATTHFLSLVDQTKNFLGGGPLHRVDHFELSYASLAQRIRPGSLKKLNFGRKLPVLG